MASRPALPAADAPAERSMQVTYSIGPKHRKTIIRLPCDPEADPEVRKSPLPVAAGVGARANRRLRCMKNRS